MVLSHSLATFPSPFRSTSVAPCYECVMCVVVGCKHTNAMHIKTHIRMFLGIYWGLVCGM